MDFSRDEMTPREPVEECVRRALIQLGDMDAVKDSIRTVGDRLSEIAQKAKEAVPRRDTPESPQ